MPSTMSARCDRAWSMATMHAPSESMGRRLGAAVCATPLGVTRSPAARNCSRSTRASSTVMALLSAATAASASLAFMQNDTSAL